ncbi:hypothetical protein Tco_0606041 [Tanacetum coccineum]
MVTPTTPEPRRLNAKRRTFFRPSPLSLVACHGIKTCCVYITYSIDLLLPPSLSVIGEVDDANIVLMTD